MSKILANLNPKQQEAVIYNEGPILVFAGAGTGKTRTLTHRIAYLIEEEGISPEHILAITFTNKATKEMRERLEQMLDDSYKKVTISTFHAFCVQVLRRYAQLLDYQNNFRIFDDNDQLRIVREILKEKNINKIILPPASAKKQINYYKTFHTKPSMDDINHDLIVDLIKTYNKQLKFYNAFDFQDLLDKTLELFQKYPHVLEQYQERYQYILVDEFQDTDIIQYNIIKMMAEKYKNIFVVGDDDQSIYGFRGTNYENMNLFQRDFPDFKKIHLEQNYRSSQAILDISNKLISHNEYREEKALFSEREGKKSDVILRQVDDEKDEATYAIGLVKRLKDEGYNYSDIAILYRNSSLSRNFETEAIANSIPYKIYGGYSFTERAEIKDAVAYLRLLLDDDQLSFERIYNRPLRGVGKVTYDKIAAFLDEDPSIANAIDKSKDLLRIDIFENLLKLKDTVLKYRDLLEKQDIQVLFNNYLTEVGYFEYLTEKLEDEDKIQNVLELKSILVELEEDQIFNSNRERLVGLFDYVVLTESKNKKEQGEKDELLLSTIHSVKGLEFKVVILTAIENGILPYGYVSNLTIQELEEERRVAYVAITRAKEKVYLTHTQRRLSMGRGRMNIIPSIFLQDIFDSVKEANILNREKRNQIREDRDKFNVGDKVSHKTFGTGIIVSINANYGQIAFSGGKGIKKIFLSPKFLTII